MGCSVTSNPFIYMTTSRGMWNGKVTLWCCTKALIPTQRLKDRHKSAGSQEKEIFNGKGDLSDLRPQV